MDCSSVSGVIVATESFMISQMLIMCCRSHEFTVSKAYFCHWVPSNTSALDVITSLLQHGKDNYLNTRFRVGVLCLA